MNPSPTTCDPAWIDQFLTHKLTDGEQTTFERHLDDCTACRDRLEAAAASDDVWSGVRESLQQPAASPESAQADDLTLDAADGDETVHSHQRVLELLAPTDDERMLGRLGAYEVLGVVGAGGMGVVLKAFDAALNRYVAIKVLAPHLASSGAARKRFSREAQAAAAVVHENVIEIHGVNEAQGLPYLVMPYVPGPSLQRRLDEEGPLDLNEVLRICVQAAKGLAAAHAQGLVHRDVTPANILLADGVERVTLTDFGLARAADDASLTRTGVIAGTPQYMSPEQARGEVVDARSDLFSLGSVLYAMCAGHAPFRAETSYGVLRRITDDEPRPIREINPNIPAWLCQIISQLMSKQPDDRFDSADEVAELLEACLAHVQQPTLVPLPKSCCSQPATGGFRRGPVLKLLIAAAFALPLIFVGVLIMLEWNKGQLTIESNADDVRVRIMQGDQVVDKLTVTSRGAAVRVAAGKYRVEIDGASDGFTIEGETVILQRGGKEIVKIVKQDAPHDDVDNAGNTDAEIDFEGVLTAPQVVRHGQELSHRMRQVTVRIRVGSVERIGVTDPHGKEQKLWQLKAADASDFSVWLSPELEAELKRREVADIAQALTGKTIEVDGILGATALLLYGSPETIWTYHIEAKSLDRLRLVEPAGDDPLGAAAAVGPTPRGRIHPGHDVSVVAFSRDGKLLALGGERGRVSVVEAETWKVLAEITMLGRDEEAILSDDKVRVPMSEGRPYVEVRALAFSPNSNLLAVGSTLGQVKLFDARTGALVRAFDDVDRSRDDKGPLPKLLTLPLAHGGVEALAFSPNGSWLATCGEAIDYRQDGVSRLGAGPSSGLLKLWRVESGEMKFDLQGEHNGQVLDVAFSPDGSFLASAGNWRNNNSAGSGVKLWDPQSGELKKVLPVPNGHLGGGSPLSVSFSPDGKRLAMGLMQYDKSTDVTSGSIDVVYPASGVLDLSWRVPLSARPVAFSPDGKFVVARSGEHEITFFDAKTGERRFKIQPRANADGEIWKSFACSPDIGVFVVSGRDAGKRGFVEVWRLTET